MRIYSILIIIIFFHCCADGRKTKPATTKFVFIKSSGSFDSISKLLTQKIKYGPWGQVLLDYKDKDYSISSLDFGEWGGYLIFKDSSDKSKYLLTQSSIFSFGKTDSSYITFSHSGHGMCSSISEIKQPKKLYRLCDTCRYLPEKSEITAALESAFLKQNVINGISDINDTALGFVGVFSFKNQIFSVQSDYVPIMKSANVTVLSLVNMENRTYTVIDTFLNTAIIPYQTSGINNLFAKRQYIPFNTMPGSKKGFLIIQADTINIVMDETKTE